TNDTFTVAATSGNVVVNGRVTLSPTSIETLTLNGYEGDDTFTVTGAVPYTTTNINAGGPSASDLANLNGNCAAAIDAQIGNSDGTAIVKGGGLGTVTLSGVEVANLKAATQNLNVSTTAGADVLVATPTGANAATLRANNVSPTVNGTSIGTLN